jgi:XTP/dITP diphosphohydrolase
MRVLLATRSAHKAGEIREILAGVAGLEIVTLKDVGLPETPEEDALEVFDTFEENALAKAQYFREKTGLPTLADDSGLEVDALGGAPGVRTKRFAPDRGLEGQARDDDNNRYLVERLAAVPEEERTARYVCVAVLAGARGHHVFRGEAPGRILGEYRGRGGFGYDPLFFDPELGRTFAEVPADEKNARSHRGKAFRALAAFLQSSALSGEDEAGEG